MIAILAAVVGYQCELLADKVAVEPFQIGRLGIGRREPILRVVVVVSIAFRTPRGIHATANANPMQAGGSSDPRRSFAPKNEGCFIPIAYLSLPSATSPDMAQMAAWKQLAPLKSALFRGFTQTRGLFIASQGLLVQGLSSPPSSPLLARKGGCSMFFSFDGIDGTGKSTQMELFCDWLQ